MKQQEIVNGLIQLGFNSGWAIQGEKIVLWQNSKPQPSLEEIEDASKLFEQDKKAQAEAKEIAKAEILAKLGLTEEEAKLLLS